MYKDSYGNFCFDGGEDDVALEWMWACLTDLSWRGLIETIVRMIFKRPPYHLWEE